MDAMTPWWGSGLFTVAGAVLGAVPTLVLGLLDRRSQRHRLSRERKETDYPELINAARTLAETPVWAEENRAFGNAGDRFRELDALTQRVTFFSPSSVNRTLPALLGAGNALVDTIAEIRGNSRPTHGNGIDQRYAQQHTDAVTQLNDAITTFANAARRDLEIPSGYTLVRASEEANGG